MLDVKAPRSAVKRDHDQRQDGQEDEHGSGEGVNDELAQRRVPAAALFATGLFECLIDLRRKGSLIVEMTVLLRSLIPWRHDADVYRRSQHHQEEDKTENEIQSQWRQIPGTTSVEELACEQTGLEDQS